MINKCVLLVIIMMMSGCSNTLQKNDCFVYSDAPTEDNYIYHVVEVGRLSLLAEKYGGPTVLVYNKQAANIRQIDCFDFF